MSHPTEESLAENEPTSAGGLNVSAIMLVGLISIVLLIVITLSAQAWFYNLRDTRIAREQYPKPNKQVRAYEAQQRRRLHTGRWLDEQRTRAAIPIDRAMEMYVEGGIR